MAHKQKTEKLSEKAKQDIKTKHYEEKAQLIQGLADERKKENGLTIQLLKIEKALEFVREIISLTNKYPNEKPFKVYGTWAIFMPKVEADKQLALDQSEYEKQCETVKKQIQFAVEKQIEFENRLKRLPTFPERLDAKT